MSQDKITYQKAGVDPEKAAAILSRFGAFQKGRPKDPALLSGIGPFASCYALGPALSGLAEPILVTSCDGVGTKAKLALDWGKIGDLGQDLVAMNVNDILCIGAKPLLFLDYYACGKLAESQLLTLLQSIQAGCEMAGCSLAGGETAEMPGLYSGEDFDLAGFTVGIVDKNRVLGASRVKNGDVLVAIGSSGLHSNGYSLVRKVVERAKLDPNAKTPFSAQTWRDLLLAPTRIYVKALTPIFDNIHAAAHITGGGLFENLPRVLPKGACATVSSKQWVFPPLFQWLQDQAGLNTQEILSTLNCGVGMILALAPEKKAAVCQSLEAHGEKAWEIGTIKLENSSAEPLIVWQ